MKIALLGAPGSGRTRLAAELSAHLATRGQDPTNIADGTLLLAAVERDYRLSDGSLYDSALAQQRGYDLTLLMGLDLPSPPNLFAQECEALDTLLRSALQRGGISYRLIYGQGAQRLAQALQAISAAAKAVEPTARWIWACDKCSDPDCEHRLFTERLR